MELLNLQSSLNSEIQAKQQISEQLTRVKQEYSSAESYVTLINVQFHPELVFKFLKKYSEF